MMTLPALPRFVPIIRHGLFLGLAMPTNGKNFGKRAMTRYGQAMRFFQAVLALQLMSVFLFRAWPNVLKTRLPISQRMI